MCYAVNELTWDEVEQKNNEKEPSLFPTFQSEQSKLRFDT